MSRAQANFIFFLVALIWGSTFILNKWCLSTTGPSSFMAWRYLIATVTLFLFVRRIRFTRAEWIAGSIIGASLGFGYLFQTVGLQYTTAGRCGFVTGLYIVMVPVFAAIFLKHSVSAKAKRGIAVATFGLFLLSSTGMDFTVAYGDLLTFIAAMLFAAQFLLVEHYAPKMHAMNLTFIELLVGTVICFSVAIFFENPFAVSYGWNVWAVILFAAIVGTIFPFAAQMKAQRYSTPEQVALIMALESPFAALFGWLLGGETMQPIELTGAMLMLLGAFYVLKVGASTTVSAPSHSVDV